MTEPQTLVSLNESMEHLARHFSGSETVGSHFFADAQSTVLSRVEEELQKRFLDAQKTGEPVGRMVFQLVFDKPVGTDALVKLSDYAANAKAVVIRDAGTPHETQVTAVASDNIKKTNIVTVIAGAYGNTGKWGIYTLFPGTEAPAFPNDRQPEVARAESVAFWQNHGFMARPDIIAKHPKVQLKT